MKSPRVPGFRRCRHPRAVRARLAISLGLLLIIAGCTTNQAADVASYRDLVVPTIATVPDDGAPLSLEEAARLAIASSESLAITGEELVRAVADRRRAVGNFLPTVDVLSTFVFRDESNLGGSIEGQSSATTLWDTSVNARVTLFDGFRNTNILKAADATIDERRALLLDLRETLLIDLVRTYYAVLVAERSVNVLERSLEVQLERLRDIKAREAAGLARPLDVYQTEAQAASTRVALREARATVDTGRELLAFLVGAPIEHCPLSDGFDVPEEPPSFESLETTAITSRQDLAAAAAAADAARALVDAAIGQYAPTVSLNLEWFLNRDMVPTDRDWTGLLAINLPIFSAGRIEADIQDAWAIFRQRVLAYQQIRRLIGRDLSVTLTEFVATREILVDLAIEVSAARQAYRQADGSYQVGLATNLERLVALDQQLAAELEEALEIYRLKGRYAAVLRSAGVLTPALLREPVELPPPRPAPESPFIHLSPVTSTPLSS